MEVNALVWQVRDGLDHSLATSDLWPLSLLLQERSIPYKRDLKILATALPGPSREALRRLWHFFEKLIDYCALLLVGVAAAISLLEDSAPPRVYRIVPFPPRVGLGGCLPPFKLVCRNFAAVFCPVDVTRLDPVVILTHAALWSNQRIL